MNERELLKLKEQVREAEQEAAQLDGQRKLLLGQLKEQFGVSTIEAAEKKLADLDDDLRDKEDKLRKAIAAVEERYAAAG